MSAVERLEDRRGEKLPRRDMEPVEASSIEAQLTQSPAKGGARLRPLLALAPYVARYRGRASLALIALTIAAITTLLVPVAVRRMIDFGFTPEGIAMINSYFSVMIAVVAVLAGASAARFYLVMTIGERIVADLRRDVFAHLISLSPAFFDSARSGELISRLTADPTQIKSAVGASVSIAPRNLMLFIGATTMMGITSPRLSGFGLLAIPGIVIPLVGFGRWVRAVLRMGTLVGNSWRQIASHGTGIAARFAGAGARRRQLRKRQLRLSDAAGRAGGRWRFALGARRRKGCDRRPVRCGQEHAVSLAAAVLRPRRRGGLVGRRTDRSGRSARGALPHRAGAAGLRGVRRDRPGKHPLRPARR